MAFLATIAAGLVSREFPGLLPAFLGKYPGDALWSLMVFFGIGAMCPKATDVRVAAMALGLAYAVEVLELWQAPWLVQARHTTIGHLVFGHVFSSQNLVACAVGVLLGLATLAAVSVDLRRVVRQRPRTPLNNMGAHPLPRQPMTDPRNVAHDKKVQQEKKHQHQEIAPGADETPQPGKKTHMAHHASDEPKVPDEAAPEPSGEKPLV